MQNHEIILPWQIECWQQLNSCWQQQRLPHALLFLGAEGVGKKQFAHALAEKLLCPHSHISGKPCGQCHSCHLIQAGSHPDFLIIQPEQAGHAIKVDQIREVVHFIQETALQSGYRVVLINPANAMNLNAANALLKTLEEPTANTLFILICHAGNQLPITITSRCQRIRFNNPPRAMAEHWLQNKIDATVDKTLLLDLANGAPLKALQLLEQNIFALRQDLYQGLYGISEKKIDPLTVAATLQDKDIFLVIHLLQLWLRDLLRLMLTKNVSTIINEDYRKIFTELGGKISAMNLQKYWDHIQMLYTQIVAGINLNRQLLFEELFTLWRQYVVSR